MGKTDSLITAVHLAIKGSGGSFKTKHNHLREALRFVETLRQIGYGVQKWSNITNKHVGAVVQRWKKVDGLKNSTLKEYLSGVRLVARYFGNRNIAPDNKAFGIQNRTYVTNHDKSLNQDIYEKTVAGLQQSNDVNDNRIAAQLILQRHLGLRKEESFKFNASRAVFKRWKGLCF